MLSPYSLSVGSWDVQLTSHGELYYPWPNAPLLFPVEWSCYFYVMEPRSVHVSPRDMLCPGKCTQKCWFLHESNALQIANYRELSCRVTNIPVYLGLRVFLGCGTFSAKIQRYQIKEDESVPFGFIDQSSPKMSGYQVILWLLRSPAQSFYQPPCKCNDLLSHFLL